MRDWTKEFPLRETPSPLAGEGRGEGYKRQRVTCTYRHKHRRHSSDTSPSFQRRLESSELMQRLRRYQPALARRQLGWDGWNLLNGAETEEMPACAGMTAVGREIPASPAGTPNRLNFRNDGAGGQGIKKLIHQSPYFIDGEVAGVVEMSIELPAEMPHYVRS